MKRTISIVSAAVLGAAMSINASAVPVDIAFVVDQSGSMSAEFNWIPTVMTEIDTALGGYSQVTSTRYGVAGYERLTGTQNARNAYNDLTSDISAVSGEVSSSSLYGAVEKGYDAANWARTGFSWDNNAVKIMILLTDEAADQGSVIPDVGQGSDEANLGKILDDENFLLNVVTGTRYYSQWDEAVFDQNTTYKGLFDINTLRTNATQFTNDFVNAKVAEIVSQIPVTPPAPQDPTTPAPPPPVSTVSEPGTVFLFGLGLTGLGFFRSRQQKKQG
jgi:hypothetical protein